MVETPRHLARDLDMRDLILSHRHESGAVQQDVGALQQRITQKPVGRQIALLELLLLVLVARHTFEPAERRDHREQQVQFGVLGHMRLHEQGGDTGIEAGGQPVDHHLADRLGNTRGVLVARGQRVPVRDEEIALVLILELYPVAQCAVVVAQMQRSGGAHAGEHALAWGISTHRDRLPAWVAGLCRYRGDYTGFAATSHSTPASFPRPWRTSTGGETARSTTVVGSMPQCPPSRMTSS